MPSPKRRRREEEDGDDRPQKKKKKKKPTGLGMLPIILGGAGGVLLILIIVGVVIALAMGNRSGDKRGAPLAKDGGGAGKGLKGAAGLQAYLANYNPARSRLIEAENQFKPGLEQGKISRPRFNELRSVFNSVRAESAAWSVPEDSSAKQLHQSFQEYLTLYETQVQWMEQVLTGVEGGNRTPMPQRPNKDAYASKERELNNLARSIGATSGL